MDLAKIIDLARTTYKWTYKHATSVFIEYEKFLFLRSTNDQLSPSSDIDDLWHTHILCTKQYELYCMHKFKTMIHHDALDSIDQTARIDRLKNTLVEYKRIFGEYDARIWAADIKPEETQSFETAVAPPAKRVIRRSLC